MNMDDQSQFLGLIAERLHALDIQYMLTGSMVLAIYAIPRMTRDIDIVVDISIADVSRFVGAFKDDCYIDEPAVLDAVSHHAMFNVIHNELLVKADFIVKKTHPYRIAEFNRRTSFLFDNQELQLVSPEDLILSKLSWAKDCSTDRQLEDIRQILAGKKKLDLTYINEWAKELGLSSIWLKVKNKYE